MELYKENPTWPSHRIYSKASEEVPLGELKVNCIEGPTSLPKKTQFPTSWALDKLSGMKSRIIYVSSRRKPDLVYNRYWLTEESLSHNNQDAFSTKSIILSQDYEIYAFHLPKLYPHVKYIKCCIMCSYKLLAFCSDSFLVQQFKCVRVSFYRFRLMWVWFETTGITIFVSKDI